MSKVLIAGGGAAGMFAAITAARQGQEVHVYEKNEKLGKKLFITGKGRCNITNACDMDTLFDSVITNSKFLYSSFYGYTNQDVIDFFENVYQLFFFLISNFRSRIIPRMSFGRWKQRCEDWECISIFIPV